MPLLQKKNKTLSKQKSKTKFQRRINIKILKLFQKTEEKGMLSTYFTRSALPDTKPDKDGERKENDTSIPPVHLDVKILNKILVNRI